MSSDLMYSKIVDFLEKDGAICNFYDKNYDENETYTNPIGNRGLFKRFNDTVTLYHKLLKYLTGEIRCDITESIPVIDYNIPTYTSFLRTYKNREDGTIDPSAIYDIKNESNNLLELQVNQLLEINPEKSLINRAIMGEDASKLFYNTSSYNKSSAFIYADHIKSDDFYYTYLGSKRDKINGVSENISVENITIYVAEIKDNRALCGMVVNPTNKDISTYCDITSGNYYISDTMSSSPFIKIKKWEGFNNSTEESNIQNIFDLEASHKDGQTVISINNRSDSNNSFYIVKIPTTYEHINNYKFMLIQKTKNSEDSSKEEYSYNVLYIFTSKDPDTNIIFEELGIHKPFPSYLNDDIIIGYINNFVKSEKVFYSDYAGILNGQFSYPIEYTDDDKTTVSRWAYAHSNNTSTSDGYMYYDGHILGRGSFLNSCTALTPSDYTLTNGKEYKGKLSLYYDRVSSSLSNIFNNLSYNDYNEWIKNFNTFNYVYSVVNLYDITDTKNLKPIDINSKFGIEYVSKNETMKYPNKCKVPLVESEDLKEYLKSLFKSYWGNQPNKDFYLNFSNGTIYLRLGAFDKVSHSSRTYKSGNFWSQVNDGYVEDDQYKSKSPTEENIHSKAGLHCKLKFTRCYHHEGFDTKTKNCKTYRYKRYNGLKDVSVELASPIDDFCRKDVSNPPIILIYPQSDTYFSTELYLLSTEKLCAPDTNEEITTDNSPSSVVTFCSKSSLIAYRCIEKYSYTPSKLNKVEIVDDLKVTKTYITKHDCGEPYTSSLTSSNISLSSKDCYLYILKALDINLDSSTSMYDYHNNPIDTSSILGNIEVSSMPITYPKSFFEVIKEENSISNKGVRYKIVENGRSQINSLKNMRIIIGLPPTDNASYLKIKALGSNLLTFITRQKYSQLNSFSKFIKDRLLPIKNNLISTISKKVFLNWAITDSNTNPVTIESLPSYFKGLKNMRDILYNMESKSMSFAIDGKKVSINKNDITYLSRLIDNDTTSTYDMVVEKGTASTLEETLTKSFIKIFSKNVEINNSKSSLEQLCDSISRVADKNKDAVYEDYEYIDFFLGNSTCKIINTSKEDGEFTLPDIFTEELFSINQKQDDNSEVTHRVDWKLYITNEIGRICYEQLGNSEELYNKVFSYFLTMSDSNTEIHNITFPDIVLNNETGEVGFYTIGNNTGSISVNVPKLENGNVVPSGNIVQVRIGMLDTYDSPTNKSIYADKNYIPFDKLYSISEYIKKELDGGEPIRFIEGYEDIIGSTESLYYKRYKALNSRINTMSGDLYFAALTFKNIDLVSKKESIDISVVDSYSDDMLVLPISTMSKSKWLPEQEATLTTVKLKGKLYDEDIAESLRSTINNRCVLTCKSCTLKAGCPFYNEDEIIKMYVPDLEYIKFSLKDNKLNLISEVDFDLKSKDREIKFSELDNMHHKWASITNYNINGETINYEFRKIEDEEKKIKSKIPQYIDENTQGLGWLTKARYGTITSNKRLKNLENEEYDPSQLYDYRYLYDAMFIYDEESYFKYKDSTYKYDVEVNLKENGFDNQVVDNLYKGSVRLKMPYSLDFSNNGKYDYSEDDLLFLVSDDTVDDVGNPIIPIIYINTLRKAMEYSVFDLNEIQNVEDEINTDTDDGLYPKDVAQWSVNILKGDCVDEPLSEIDDNKNYDQYWMPELKKRVLGSDGKYRYITINGRPRENTTHMGEMFTSVDHVNELAVVSGKPVIGMYQDFTRSFMLSTSIIKWVYSPMVTQFGKDLTYEQVIDKQKSTLPCMKTNLRFVLLKNNEKITI